mgnify:CR=1 FL=1
MVIPMHNSNNSCQRCTQVWCLPKSNRFCSWKVWRSGYPYAFSFVWSWSLVVNGAAGNFLCPIEGMSSNAFKTVIDIDLFGTFNLSKAALPALKQSKGCIINISATLHYTATPFQAHVSAAKVWASILENLMTRLPLIRSLNLLLWSGVHTEFPLQALPLVCTRCFVVLINNRPNQGHWRMGPTCRWASGRGCVGWHSVGTTWHVPRYLAHHPIPCNCWKIHQWYNLSCRRWSLDRTESSNCIKG